MGTGLRVPGKVAEGCRQLDPPWPGWEPASASTVPRRWRAGALQTHGPGAALAEGECPPVRGWKRSGEMGRGVCRGRTERWTGKRHRACRGGQIARMLRSSVHETPQAPSACAAKGNPARFGAHVEAGTPATQPARKQSRAVQFPMQQCQALALALGKAHLPASPRAGRGRRAAGVPLSPCGWLPS